MVLIEGFGPNSAIFSTFISSGSLSTLTCFAKESDQAWPKKAKSKELE